MLKLLLTTIKYQNPTPKIISQMRHLFFICSFLLMTSAITAQFTLSPGAIKKSSKKSTSNITKEKPFAKVIIGSDMKGTIYFDEKPYPINAGEKKTFDVYKKSFYYFLTPQEDYHTNILDFGDKTDLIHNKGDVLQGDDYNLRIYNQYLAFKRDEKVLSKIQNNFQQIAPANNNYEKFRSVLMSKYEVTVDEYALFDRRGGSKENRINESAIVDFKRKSKFARAIALNVNWEKDAIGQNVKEKEKEKYPVVNVSWSEAKAFCNWLSEQDKDFDYRLPTREEWIYFAQCGALEKRYPWGENLEEAKGQANFRDLRMQLAWNDTQTRRKYEQFDDCHVYTSPVGTYKPNCFGIYDLGGNVAEWLEDSFTKTTGGKRELHRQFIGGSYFSTIDFCDLNKLKQGPKGNQALPEDVRNSGVGFRVVKTPKVE